MASRIISCCSDHSIMGGLLALVHLRAYKFHQQDSTARVPSPACGGRPGWGPAAMTTTIYTIGHSTRPGEELIAVLQDAGVRSLADVRRFPSSRRFPQFNRGALERALPEADIAYAWLGESLGGRRRQTVPVEQSRNNAWNVAAFRYYADAMSGAEFRAGIAALE